MKTALYDHHVALGAKIVDFSGWDMPISYKGIVAEHLAVRRSVGIFDVSHMGRILVTGVDAEAFLNYVSTNNIAAESDHLAIYTVWASEEGGSVDDTIVYRQSPTEFFVIVNASNRQKDLDHLVHIARSYRVEITPHYAEEGILAIQGPEAEPVVRSVLEGNWQLKPMHFVSLPYHGFEVILTRSGYTGSGGFEVIAPNAVIPQLWEAFLKAGRIFEIQPVGLGARDTLRLEAGYALYGHELADNIAPTESVSAWTVKWKKGDFLGQEAMLRLEHSPSKRSQHGVILQEPGIPRAGCTVWKSGKEIGVVTSGTHSPCLSKGIAIVMVSSNLALGEVVEIEVRERRLKAEVIKLPFFKMGK